MANRRRQSLTILRPPITIQAGQSNLFWVIDIDEFGNLIFQTQSSTGELTTIQTILRP